MSEVLEYSNFQFTQDLLNKMDSSRDLLRLKRKDDCIFIEDCIGKEDLFSTVEDFCKHTSIKMDYIFSLIDILLFYITAKNQPKILVSFESLNTGEYDFSFSVEDFLVLLKNKKPSSRPRRDTKQKKYVPQYKETKVVNTFGLLFDPKTKTMVIRYQIYPQKKLYGFRYIEHFREFKDLVSFLAPDLANYMNEDTSEIKIVDDFEEEEVTFEDEM